MDELLTQKELSARLKIGRSAFFEMVKRGDLPQPISIGPRLKRWRARDVERHLGLTDGTRASAV